MATDRQIEANRRNAQRSTGAKTEEGRKASSSNAIKHGILSCRAILPHESAAEFEEFKQGISFSFSPRNAYEGVLVDKIALALWKQKRLAAAERAELEIATDIRRKAFRQRIANAEDVDSFGGLITPDYHIIDKEEAARIAELRKAKAEAEALLENEPEEVTAADLKASYPTLYEWIEGEAEEAGVKVGEFISNRSAFLDWLQDTYSMLSSGVKKAQENEKAQETIALVREIGSVTLSDRSDLYQRYQVSLDNEVYKAVDALKRYRELC